MKRLNYYYWQGITSSGEKKAGTLAASDLTTAKATLRKQGIISKKILKKRVSLFNNKKITPKDIHFFSRQLATMIKAGIPLLHTFDTLAKGQVNPRMRHLIETIKQDIETGQTLAQSLRKHPAFFSKLVCNLIDAGETSGSLETMLSKVALYKENIETIKRKIKKALTYPTIVFIVAQLVTATLLIFVVPQFESLYKDLGAQLPWLTQKVIHLSTFFKTYWHLMTIIIGCFLYVFIYAKNNYPSFHRFMDKLLLRSPILGPVIAQAIIARFSRTLSIIFAAGLPLIEALQLVAGVTGNSLYVRATEQIQADISAGQTMRGAMENTGLFPNLVIQMVAIGEESGALEKMLGKVADFYEDDLDQSMDLLSSLLEPCVMLLLGALVGGLVIAMYLPLFKLGSVM